MGESSILPHHPRHHPRPHPGRGPGPLRRQTPRKLRRKIIDHRALALGLHRLRHPAQMHGDIIPRRQLIGRPIPVWRDLGVRPDHREHRSGRQIGQSKGISPRQMDQGMASIRRQKHRQLRRQWPGRPVHRQNTDRTPTEHRTPARGQRPVPPFRTCFGTPDRDARGRPLG